MLYSSMKNKKFKKIASMIFKQEKSMTEMISLFLLMLFT